MFDPVKLHTQRFGGVSTTTDTENSVTKTTTTSTGFDPVKLHAQRFGETAAPKSNSKTGNYLTDAVVGATQFGVSEYLKKKTIPEGIFDAGALGINKVQGWCGEYASRLSTATKVGDTWAEKKTHIDKRSGIKAGDKVLTPLGVTYDKNGKPHGWGHVVVALTDEDENGNWAAAQSNADGRQNTNNANPGIATFGVFNTNDLNKRYGEDWGAASGKLKVNVYADKEAGKKVMFQGGVEGAIYDALAFGAKSVAGKYKDANAGAPPDIDKVDYSAEGLADWVVKNGITDLTSKKWWQDSPVKNEAWRLVQKKLGKEVGKYDVPGISFNQEKLDPKKTDFHRAILGVLDPNGLLGGDLTENEYAQRADFQKNLNIIGATAQERVQEKVFNQPRGTLANNPVTRALGGSVASIGSGLEKLTGGVGGQGESEYVNGFKEVFFGGLGLTNPSVARFNIAIELPVVDQVADAVFTTVGNLNNASLDVINTQKGEFRDLLNFGLEFGEFALAHKVLKGAKDKAVATTTKLVTTKKTKFSASQVKDAFLEVTGGKPINKPSEVLIKEVKTLIKDSAEGVKQKEVLKKSFKKGITVTEARDFTTWFNKFFGKVDIKKADPAFVKLITDGKKVANGTLDPVTFAKDARGVMVPGESATLRNNLGKMDPKNPALYDRDGSGALLIDQVGQSAARLQMLQEAGKQEILKVTYQEGTPALSVHTYTYSDQKVGIGYDLSVDGTNLKAPIQGAYDNPREAVKAILPTIEKAVEKGSDIASEAIRTEIDKLKETRFSEIPEKAEIMPWEDNYVPPAPKEDLSKLSKEAIQSKIDTMLDEYIKTALNEGKGQGVTQGGLARDALTGDVVGRQGRISNNPEWYRKAFAEMGGRTPTKAKIREIARDHLLNGVTDKTIGEIPADPQFKALVEALVTAKPQKVLDMKPLPSEGRDIPKSTVSTPESRSVGVDRPLESTGGKMRESEAYMAEGKPLTVEQANIAKTLARAEDFVENNFEVAQKIMRGIELPPESIDKGSILTALRNKARELDMPELMGEASLALSRYKTRAGQNLALLKGDKLQNTVEDFVQQVVSMRMQRGGEGIVNFSTGELKSKAVEKLEEQVAELKKQLREGVYDGGEKQKGQQKRTKKQKDADLAQKIIDALTCT